ncbi:hypothetical protein LCGC14_0902300 [marine sediment metagenome]|uniref:Macro domain-containing protein n=1 Tax=marine sediment metagenome TaxID=412755 RepID=A0A0F9NW08_9ZZZZ
MREVKGNIWDFYDRGGWITIPTNGSTRNDGKAVMGRGLALQANQRFKGFAGGLGHFLKDHGNVSHVNYIYRAITFPVKHHWMDIADINLIEVSALTLPGILDRVELKEIYMVRVGCGNGKLDWKDVKPILEKYLDDRFIIVDKKGEEK